MSEEEKTRRPEQVLTIADRLMTSLSLTGMAMEDGDLNTLKTLTAVLKDLRDIQSKAEAELRGLGAGEESGTGIILMPAREDE